MSQFRARPRWGLVDLTRARRRLANICSMASLYLSMTEAVINHWKANCNAYPQKFVLSPAQYEGYARTRRNGIGGAKANINEHMGIPVEVAEGTPGVMVAADGSEVSLR